MMQFCDPSDVRALDHLHVRWIQVLGCLAQVPKLVTTQSINFMGRLPRAVNGNTRQVMHAVSSTYACNGRN
jgi:hypothetical protein